MAGNIKWDGPSLPKKLESEFFYQQLKSKAWNTEQKPRRFQYVRGVGIVDRQSAPSFEQEIQLELAGYAPLGTEVDWTAPLRALSVVVDVCTYAEGVEILGADGKPLLTVPEIDYCACRSPFELSAIDGVEKQLDALKDEALVRQAQRLVREVPICSQTGQPVKIEVMSEKVGHEPHETVNFVCPHCNDLLYPKGDSDDK